MTSLLATNAPVTYALFVIRKEPVTSVLVKCLMVVPSSLVFESTIWKLLVALGNLLFVKCVSFPKLLNVSGPVIRADDVIGLPETA